MKLALLVSSILFSSQLCQAAITADFECTDGNGAVVTWESQLGIYDKDGNITGENLYRNTVRVKVGSEEVTLTPSKSLTNSRGLLAAWTTDGQYVLVNAIHKVKDEEDTAIFSGTMEFKVKGRNGKLSRPESTTVTCRMQGEA